MAESTFNFEEFFASIGNSAEEIQEAIDIILDPNGPFSFVGSNLPAQLAEGALSNLNAIEQNIQGALQVREQNIELSDQNISEIQQTLSEQQADLQFALDNPEGRETKIARLQETVAKLENDLARLEQDKQRWVDEKGALERGEDVPGFSFAEETADNLNRAFSILTEGTDNLDLQGWFTQVEEDRADVERRIRQAEANIANILDFPDDISEEERARLTAQAEQIRQQELDDDVLAKAEFFGINVGDPDALFRTSAGFITEEERQSGGYAPTEPGGADRPGVGSTVEEQEDGTFAIVNADGSVLEGGFTNISEALARQTQLASGGTPTISGRPDLFAVAPDESTPDDLRAVEEGNAFVATPNESGVGFEEFGQASADTPRQIANVEELERLAGLGLTEADIIRQNGSIFLAPGITEESLGQRGAGSQQITSGVGSQVPTTALSGGGGVGVVDSSVQQQQMSTLFPDRGQILTEQMEALGLGTEEDIAALQGTIGEGIMEQESALRELPETIRQRTENVGVTQGQLNRLVATEREPMAQALKDLLMSRSLLNEQIGTAFQRAEFISQGEEAKFDRFTGLLAQQGQTIDPVTGNIVETFAAKQARIDNEYRNTVLQAQMMTPAMKEYELAAQQGFSGTFLDYQYLSQGPGTPSMSPDKILSAAMDLIGEGVETNLTDAIAHVQNALSGNPSGTNIGSSAPVNSNVRSAIGNGVITGYGSEYWEPGLDFVLEGGKGASVAVPFAFEVVGTDSNTGFGNRVKIKTLDGQEMWFSHLDQINIGPGSYEAGTVIGTQGNSGNVYSNSGGDGTHLDITMPRADGSYYSAHEVASYLGFGSLDTTQERLTNTQLEQVNKIGDDLRGEPAYNDMLDIYNGYRSVQVGAQLSNGPGDLTLVNGYQRMIDPGAVVREGEFKTVEEAQGWIRSVLNIPGKVTEGDRLTDSARQQFLEAANGLYTSSVNTFNSTITERYQRRAEAANVPFDLIGNVFPSVDEILQQSQSTQGGINQSNNDPLGLGIGFNMSSDPLGILAF